MDRKASRECSEVLRFIFLASTIGLLGTPLLTAILMALSGFALGEPGIDMARTFLDSTLLSFSKSVGCFYLVGIAGLVLLFGFRAENADLLFTRIDRLSSTCQSLTSYDVCSLRSLDSHLSWSLGPIQPRCAIEYQSTVRVVQACIGHPI